jgi:hypothetical protein
VVAVLILAVAVVLEVFAHLLLESHLAVVLLPNLL